MDLSMYGISETDLEFLRQKEKEGNLISVTGTLSATGELVAYTPITGKTFHLITASAFADGASDNDLIRWIVQVRNNTTVKDYLGGSSDSNLTGDAGHGAQSFKTKSIIVADSLEGDGIKKYDLNISTYTAAGTVYGTILGWVEDT